MIQLQFLTCEHLFDGFLTYIDEYRTGAHASIDLTEEDWHWCNDGGDLNFKWPDLKGCEFFSDFDAALKIQKEKSDWLLTKTYSSCPYSPMDRQLRSMLLAAGSWFCISSLVTR